METQMQDVLDLLRQSDPVIVSHRWRQRLGGRRMAPVWQPCTSLELVPCPYCHRCHRVHARYREQRCFFTCSTTQAIHLIQANTLCRWQLNLPRLLKYMASELGIQPHVAQLYSSIVWRLGTVTLEDNATNVELWLCRRLSSSVLVWLLQQEINRHTVLLTLGPKPLLQQKALSLTCFDLSLLIRDPDRSHLDSRALQRWLVQIFQRVRFEPTNGDLWVDGQMVCAVMPASAPYFFLQCLWEQFDQPVSHEELFTYCRRQLAKRDNVAEWQSDYLPSTFCHTMKRLIKQQAYDKERCAEILQATRTHDEQNAYRLTPPNNQPVRSAGIVKNATNSSN